MDYIIEKLKKIGLFIDERGNLYGSKYKDFTTTVGGVWQKPEELAGMLLAIKNCGINISTYVNTGTFNGNTFHFIADYLNEINPTTSISIDPVMNPNLIKRNEYFYIDGTSDNLKNQSFDFVFIDGDHSYNGILADWQNLGQFGKVIAFHDINGDDCPDVVTFWKDITKNEDIKNAYHIYEFIEPTENRNLMGIGLLVKK